MQQYTQTTPQGPEIPQGFSIDVLGVTERGTTQYVVRHNGVPTMPTPDGGEYWHSEKEHAIQSAWGFHYGMLAEKRNEGRSEEDCILAWRLPNGEVYTVDHLEFYVPESEHVHVVLYLNDDTERHLWFPPEQIEETGHYHAIVDACSDMGIDMKTVNHWEPLEMEEITINSHRANYEIANLLCQHCGEGAVDYDILYKYRLLNEGWNTDGFYDDDDEEIDDIDPDTDEDF